MAKFPNMIWLRTTPAVPHAAAQGQFPSFAPRPSLGTRHPSLEADRWEACEAQWEKPLLRRVTSMPGIVGPSEEAALVDTLLLEHKITNLEENLRTAMGPWAMHGLRYSTLVGIAAATTVKIALAIIPFTLPLVPIVGLGIFLGLVVGGIAVGLLVQGLSRRAFVKSGQSEAYLLKIQAYQQTLTAKGILSGTEIRALRRLQLLEATIGGGFKHSLFTIMHGISGFDPELNRMMRHAQDPIQAPAGRPA